jgi:hypothetical protein
MSTEKGYIRKLFIRRFRNAEKRALKHEKEG